MGRLLQLHGKPALPYNVRRDPSCDAQALTDRERVARLDSLLMNPPLPTSAHLGTKHSIALVFAVTVIIVSIMFLYESYFMYAYIIIL